MGLLKSVRIKNFRSIVDETIQLDDYNCFVGMNDSGKSNVLKAVNLFFNGKTDFNTEFDFENDYCKYARKGTHQAKEIVISVEINIPESFKEKGVKAWSKTWRIDGLYHDNLKEIFVGKTKAIAFVSRIKYLYIPAVKSNEYFKFLLSEVYDLMTQMADSTLRKLNAEYSKQLQVLTGKLTTDIKSILKLDSEITMPRDLNTLFRDLTFSTGDEHVKNIELNHRGDGIKARHIPSILRYIQNNTEIYRKKGKISYSFIWGYEEPENGIEFSSCFEMADELYSYCNDLQLLITTHSPAFYSMRNGNNTKRYYVYKSDNGNSKYSAEIDDSEINYKIGLMPIVAPYIQEERKKYLEEKETFEKSIEQLKDKVKNITGKIVVITEGKTDTKHLKIAFQNLYPADDFVKDIEYYDFSNNEILGDDLNKLLMKLCRIDNMITIIGIFDRDKTLYTMKNKPYESLGNNVYRTNIPKISNNERTDEDKISIEHYYSNNEITKNLGNNIGHLYLGKDFDEFGVSSDGLCVFQNFATNPNIKPISIVDSNKKQIQQIKPDFKIATKNDFAEYVEKHPDEFNFENFRLIYNLIKEIVKNEDTNKEQGE